LFEVPNKYITLINPITCPKSTKGKREKLALGDWAGESTGKRSGSG
jgi:hypothetical protein